MSIDTGSIADWAQALTNTVVLLFIYKQLRLMNVQMVQNDDQERSRRSWEFVKFYREQLGPLDALLPRELINCDLSQREISDEEFRQLYELFYTPRERLYTLLSHLLQHQEVEERLLFGYLIDEFNNFVAIGVKTHGAADFKQEIGAKIPMLLSAWGAQIKARKMLFPVN